MDYTEDIPGIGYITSHLFPGNDDTTKILEELDEINN